MTSRRAQATAKPIGHDVTRNRELAALPGHKADNREDRRVGIRDHLGPAADGWRKSVAPAKGRAGWGLWRLRPPDPEPSPPCGAARRFDRT
jgi:hypothetical protein